MGNIETLGEAATAFKDLALLESGSYSSYWHLSIQGRRYYVSTIFVQH